MTERMLGLRLGPALVLSSTQQFVSSMGICRYYAADISCAARAFCHRCVPSAGRCAQPARLTLRLQTTGAKRGVLFGDYSGVLGVDFSFQKLVVPRRHATNTTISRYIVLRPTGMCSTHRLILTLLAFLTNSLSMILHRFKTSHG